VQFSQVQGSGSIARWQTVLYAAQAVPPIDAEIAEKGHLWTETIWHRSRRQMRKEDAIIV
jgi:hypothetical protein